MAIKKYSKVKFSLRKELVFILVVIAVMIVATILLQLPSKEEKFLKKWNTAGSTITENDLFVETNFSELNDIVANTKDEYVFVYFATPSDSTSVTNFDIVYKVAKQYEVEKVYLVDAKFAIGDRENDEELDKELTDIESSFGDNISLDYVPNLWSFKNGELIEEVNQDLIKAEGSWNLAVSKIFAVNKE